MLNWLTQNLFFVYGALLIPLLLLIGIIDDRIAKAKSAHASERIRNKH